MHRAWQGSARLGSSQAASISSNDVQFLNPRRIRYGADLLLRNSVGPVPHKLRAGGHGPSYIWNKRQLVGSAHPTALFFARFFFRSSYLRR